MTKFKTGDSVKVIDNSELIFFRINEETIILVTDPLSELFRYYIENEDGDGQWAMETAIDFITN